MLKSKLQIKFNKFETPENLKKYKQQRNNYFDNLNAKVIADNKKFWSVVKLLFSNKMKAMNTIVLSEKEKIMKITRKYQ